MTVDALRKKELKNAAREADRRSFIERMPLDPQSAKELFDTVNAALEDHGCKDDHRLTAEALRKMGLTPENTLIWLRDNGGGCDCEVIANVELRVEEAFRWDR